MTLNAPAAHPFMANSVPDIKQEMLDELDVANVEELFHQIPDDHRLKQPLKSAQAAALGGGTQAPPDRCPLEECDLRGKSQLSSAPAAGSIMCRRCAMRWSDAPSF